MKEQDLLEFFFVVYVVTIIALSSRPRGRIGLTSAKKLTREQENKERRRDGKKAFFLIFRVVKILAFSQYFICKNSRVPHNCP